MILQRVRVGVRRLSTAVKQRRIEDEGDWFYSSEWWGYHPDCGQTVFRSTSDEGNGVVSVLAYPSSRPIFIDFLGTISMDQIYWPETERWLQQRYMEIHPSHEKRNFRILGYQWRVLRFNDNTRQSTVKLMAAESDLGSVWFMPQAHCLAVPCKFHHLNFNGLFADDVDLKSMVSAGLSAIVSCNYNLSDAIRGKQNMHILCIGHGGGCLPLFLASKIQGAIVHSVEIDPLVISASIEAMGFPSSSVVKPSGQRAISKPKLVDEILWKGTHERLFLYEADAEKFILDTTNTYDLIFIDAYDGDDIFPHKLWDPSGLFLKTLSNRLHPDHGTVVVNLHSDSDILNLDGTKTVLPQILPMGKYVSGVCRAFKDVLVGNETCSHRNKYQGLGFTVSAPWVCNTSLVVCRGFELGGEILNRDEVLGTLVSKSFDVEKLFRLPFSWLQYLRRGFVLVD
ncbi:hypothetical protein RJ641_021475 [Dillenia turbinata]|uniref:Uncharacterized protein n=1 Tax=Dillenia turbinata TaxID=194707 RepID=A0AAN8UHL0_9MAGN